MKHLIAVTLAVLTIGSAADAKPRYGRAARYGSSTSVYTATHEDTSDKTMNLRIGVIPALIGILHIDADFGVSDSFTLGPALAYGKRKFSIGSTPVSVELGSIGARGNWYFSGNRFTQGAYLAPFLTYSRIEVIVTKSDRSLSGRANGILSGAMVGYQWVWDTFNINLGAGLQASAITDLRVKDEKTNEEYSFPTGYFGGLAAEFSFGLMF